MAILNNNPLIGSGGNQGYNINNSLRFRNSASAYLNRTPSATGNNQKFTWSGWVKRGTIGAEAKLFAAATGTSNSWYCMFGDGVVDTLTFGFFNGTAAVVVRTSAVYRDPSAWYHIVVAVDTTQATASDRVKIYVNGSQVTAFSTATYPTLNQTTHFNTASTPNYLGVTTTSTSGSFDGYMADINFIDGSQKVASDFGETDTTTGVWKPKAYTGTYGTNGFYLKFSDIATTSGSNAGLGKDFSGNSNYWTTNNISVTSGTTYDAMTDSPTLTSATVANYCTLNSTIKISSGSITEGNLKGAGSDFEGWGTIAFPSTGKFYFEYTQNGSTGAGAGPATGIQGINPPDIDYGVHYHKDGRKWVNGTYSSYGATFTTNDIIGVAYDADSNSITFYKNNVSQGAISTTSGYTYLPYQFDNSGNGGYLNFGQRPFAYTPPTGFNRLNTFNLPTSTIVKGNSYMDATLYTGNGSTQTITNAASFKPDFVWVKTRNVGTTDHCLFDAVRGVSKYLNSNNTGAEATYTGFGTTAFNSNGFTVVDNAGGGYLVNGSTGSPTYVGWQWQAGQGSTSSNTSGSITSTVSVNTTAGFSVVTYTGTGANATVGHGLGVAPSFTAVKCRNDGTIGWVNYHASLGNTKFLNLNSTNAAGTGSTVWNNTSPTSTTIALGTDSAVNGSTKTYVIYAWAEIAGFSRFGSYTGNGSADGSFIFTGFLPKFIMIKCTDTAGTAWVTYDTARDTYNQMTNILLPNSSSAELSGYSLDVLSNGFKHRQGGGDPNASGRNYIYACWASNPFKNSNAR